jgi:hypothetical protein
MHPEGEVAEKYEPIPGIALSTTERLPFCLPVLDGSFY